MRLLGWMIVLCAIALPRASAEEWVSLFDGKSLEGWRHYNNKLDITKAWAVEDGALHLKNPGKWPNGYTLISVRQFENFELRFEWRVSRGANSGVMYRVREGDSAPYLSGPEYQILDDANVGWKPNRSAAAIYGIAAAEEKSLKPAGEYNSARIIAQGNHIEHWLNGKRVVSIDIGSEEWNAALAKGKFGKQKQYAKAAKGHIAIQDHNFHVWYRNIRIRELPAQRDAD